MGERGDCARAVALAAMAAKISTKAFRLSVIAVLGVVALAAFELFPHAAAEVKGLGGAVAEATP